MYCVDFQIFTYFRKFETRYPTNNQPILCPRGVSGTPERTLRSVKSRKSCPFACPFRNNTRARICIVLIFKYLHTFVNSETRYPSVNNQPILCPGRVSGTGPCAPSMRIRYLQGSSRDPAETKSCSFACPFRNNTRARICIVLIFKYLHIFVNLKSGIQLIIQPILVLAGSPERDPALLA